MTGIKLYQQWIKELQAIPGLPEQATKELNVIAMLLEMSPVDPTEIETVLQFATKDQLVSELESRCAALVIGMAEDDEPHLYMAKNRLMCVGLIEVMMHAAMHNLMGGEDEGENGEEENGDEE